MLLKFYTIFQKFIHVAIEEPLDPCQPSPCGPNSHCKKSNDRAMCLCLPGMFGAPPNCRPECTINQDCPSNRACFGQKCQDPCIGSCGFNALCNVQNHQPICKCFEGYDGDPYSGCNIRQGEFILLVFLFSKTFFKPIS